MDARDRDESKYWCEYGNKGRQMRQISIQNMRLYPAERGRIRDNNNGKILEYIKSAVFKWYVMVMAWALCCVCVCFLKATPARITRAVSKHSATMRNVFSQQEVVGLLSASQLSLNVSLTNRAVGLHGTADNTAYFQLLFFNFFPPFFRPAQRLSMAKKMTDT